MDEDTFIFYLSPRYAVLSRGMRRLVGEDAEVLRIHILSYCVPAGLVRAPDGLVRVTQF